MLVSCTPVPPVPPVAGCTPSQWSKLASDESSVVPAVVLPPLDHTTHPLMCWAVPRKPRRRRRSARMSNKSWHKFSWRGTLALRRCIPFMLVFGEVWNAAETPAAHFRLAGEPWQGAQPGLPSLLTH